MMAKALKASKRAASTTPILWTIVATFLLTTTASPTAHGLEFPMTSRLVLPEATNLTTTSLIDLDQTASLYYQLTEKSNGFADEFALVATISRQIEMARSPAGARRVTQTLIEEQYMWGDRQFDCLNRLWTKESHWNYKAHNYKSGAHGIAQALPAVKMDVVATDWRTNPMTQIRWGLRYINIRYTTPCKAWAKFERRNFY